MNDEQPKGSVRFIVSGLLLCLPMLGGCALPTIENRVQSKAFAQENSTNTRLGLAVGEAAEKAGQKTPINNGISILDDPLDAFVTRILLAEASELSLDVQYYIWSDDLVGKLLLRALCRAADRGVRVRLLLDDHGSSGLDDTLAALNLHDNIEIRLFNPFPLRRFKALGYVTDFRRLNRRMHNKSYTADNQLSIVGGRNVANEYYGAGSGVLFSDLDVLTSGPIVNLVSQDFDSYWSSDSAYPAEQLLAPASKQDLVSVREELADIAESPEAQQYLSAVETSDFVAQLKTGQLSPVYAPVALVSDNPSKVLDAAKGEELLSQQLNKLIGTPEQSFTLVSPYFVPGKLGVQLFSDMEKRGVEVKILTNSLEANDVALVHSGYAKYRKPLLEAGVQLFEMRKSSSKEEKSRIHSGFSLGSSAASLHAKTFSVDGTKMFVGSFNFDPRSNNLNTELGFLIASPELAMLLESGFEENVKHVAYELLLTEEGDLEWLEYNGETIRRYSQDPNTGLAQRAMVFFLSLLPIEPLL